MSTYDSDPALPPPATAPASRVLHRLRELVEAYGLVLVLLGLIVVISILEPTFATSQNFANILEQWAPIAIMAIAGTFVIIAGGFDFSVGGVYAMAGVLAADLSTKMPVPAAFAIVIGFGILVGIFNGLVVTKAHVNPFIATLGSGEAIRGLAFIYTGAVPIAVSGGGFEILGTADVGPISLSAAVMLVFFVLGGVMLARSVFGRMVYAVGGNERASRFTGIPVDRVRTMTYVLSGAAAAFAGIIVASRLGQGYADVGELIALDVVIAIVLGGTAISGGSGAIWRTAVGLGILAVLQNGLESLDVDPFYQITIKGCVLIAALAWDEYVKRQRAKPREVGAG